MQYLLYLLGKVFYILCHTEEHIAKQIINKMVFKI